MRRMPARRHFNHHRHRHTDAAGLESPCYRDGAGVGAPAYRMSLDRSVVVAGALVGSSWVYRFWEAWA